MAGLQTTRMPSPLLSLEQPPAFCSVKVPLILRISLLIALPELMILTFHKMTSLLSAFILHLALSSLTLFLLDFPFFKPLQAAGSPLLLPVSDCLLPIAKVILSVIQLKLLYFLIDIFFLSSLSLPSPSCPLPCSPPLNLGFQGLLSS